MSFGSLPQQLGSSMTYLEGRTVKRLSIESSHSLESPGRLAVSSSLARLSCTGFVKVGIESCTLSKTID